MRFLAVAAIVLGLLCGCGAKESEPAPEPEKTAENPPPEPAPEVKPKKPEPPPPPPEEDRPVGDLSVEDVRAGLLGPDATEESAGKSWKEKFLHARVGWSGRVVGINNMGESFIVEMTPDLVAFVRPLMRADSIRLGQWMTFQGTVRKREPFPQDWAPEGTAIQLSHCRIVGVLPTSPELGPLFEKISGEDVTERRSAAETLGRGEFPVFCNEVGRLLQRVVGDDQDREVTLSAAAGLVALKNKSEKGATEEIKKAAVATLEKLSR